MKNTRVLIVLSALLLGVAGLISSPASAAPDATINGVTRNGCTLSISVTVQDAGTYYLVVGDDGVIIGSSGVDAAAGATVSFSFTITQNINAGAPGVGLSIGDTPNASGAIFDVIGNYDFPGSDNIAATCAATGGSSSGEGSGPYIPGETIPPSTTTTAVTSTTAVDDTTTTTADDSGTTETTVDDTTDTTVIDDTPDTPTTTSGVSGNGVTQTPGTAVPANAVSGSANFTG